MRSFKLSMVAVAMLAVMTMGMECDSQVCGDGANYANCCSGIFSTCPATHPFWCPEENLCYIGTAYPSSCSRTCTTHGWPCS